MITMENNLAGLLYTIRDKPKDVEQFDELDFFRYCMTEILIDDAYKGQNFQDAWVNYELDKDDGFYWDQFYFVDVGAGNGFDMSNTYVLAGYNSGGILVEPNPIWMSDLRKNRLAYPNEHIDNRAITGESGKILDFLCTDDPYLSTLSGFENSDEHTQTRKLNTGTKRVMTITLYDLLKEYNAPKDITYVSIDTEGNEFEILEKFFKENDRYNVRFFTVEHNFMEKKRDNIFKLMTDNGYTRKFEYFSRWDDFYTRTLQ